MNKALITGVNGQDGILLSKYLLKNNYTIIGIDKLRRRKKNPLNIKVINIDLRSKKSVTQIINRYKPSEIYHLAENSIDNRKKIKSLNKLSDSNKILFNLLDANLKINAKFFYASSSEVFGEPEKFPQSERSPFNPRSIYGFIKMNGIYLIRYYRKYYNLFACSGILYNHESYLRKNVFLIKNVINQALEIKNKKRKYFSIIDPYVSRDWSDARDFVEAFHKILSQPSPDDYIISSSKSKTVLEVIKITCKIMGLRFSDHIQISKFKKNKKVNFLVGNNIKLRQIGWKQKISFERMIKDILKIKK